MSGRSQSTGERVARTAPGVASTVARTTGVAAGPYLGPISAANGAFTMGEAAGDMAQNGVNAGNVWDMTRGAGGVTSGVAGATGAAGTAITAGSGGVGAALSASALGTAGAVAGAGLAGYGVGSLINSAGNSEYAQQDPGSVGGTHQTYRDWWLDQGTEMGGAAGMAVGVTGATFGTIADAGVAAWNYVFD